MLNSKLLGLILAVLTLLAVQAAAAADITFSGEVTYRERIALPHPAELRVTLVQLPGNKPVASATAPVAEKGEVPLAFVLDVRSSVIDPARRYGLRAEIRGGGQSLFHNAIVVPVDVQAPAAAVITVSYDPAPLPPVEEASSTPAARPLFGTSWVVTSIGGDPVLPGTEPTLMIDADGRAGGHGGCNSYFAEASVDAEAVAFGPVAGTRLACDSHIMEQEARFFAALAATAGFMATDSALQLRDAAGVTLAGLVRAR